MLLLIIDFGVLLMHLVLGKRYGLFNIDWERNVPTMYQSFKLVLVGSIFLTIYIINKYVIRNKEVKDNYYWIGLTIILLAMGFDEVAEIHEIFPFYIRELFPSFSGWYESLFQSFGFQSSIWIIYVLPLFPFVFAWGLYVLRYVLKQYGKRLVPLIIGIVLFFIGAIVFEFIGTLDDVFFGPKYELVMLVEEMFEMVGGTVFAVFALSELNIFTKLVKNKM